MRVACSTSVAGGGRGRASGDAEPPTPSLLSRRRAMLSALRARTARALPLPSTHARAYASLLDEIGASLPEASSSAVPATAADAAGPGGRRVKRATSAGSPAAAAGKLRPHLNIDVNPNHGLYAFFRKKGDEFSKEGVHYETVEPALPSITDSGAWVCTDMKLGLTRAQAARGRRTSSAGRASATSTRSGTSSSASATCSRRSARRRGGWASRARPASRCRSS
jgi:hypothetical protein